MEELLKLAEKNPFVALGLGIGASFWMLGKLPFLKKSEKQENSNKGKEEEISWRKIALQQSSTIADMQKLINEMKIELEKRKENQIGD